VREERDEELRVEGKVGALKRRQRVVEEEEEEERFSLRERE